MVSEGLDAAAMRATERPLTVWIIDSEQWPRACLRAELIERGYDAVGFTEIKRALMALRNRRRILPDVIVLELRGQEVTRRGLETLMAKAPVIVIGGAQELNDPLTQGFTFAAILKRPVTLGRIVDVIDKIIGSATTSPVGAPGSDGC
jgi:DNA-binding NtrC family response regulator